MECEDKISPENKKRRLKTPFQVKGLENFYAEHKYPSEAMKTQLSIQLGLSKKQVQGWFGHRRLKDKRLMKKKDSDNGEQDTQNGFVQDSPNGVKGDSSSSGKKVDHQSYLTSKQSGNLQAMNATDYPAAVLASELRDQDLFTVNHDNMEETFAGRISASQERSSLHSGNPKEIGARRCLPQNGNRCETEAKRKKSEDFHMDLHSQENYEHEAVIAVKKQLGEEYREDGPPLSVEFDPIPPGACDAPMELYYHGKTNAIDDLHRTSKMEKQEEFSVHMGSIFPARNRRGLKEKRKWRKIKGRERRREEAKCNAAAEKVYLLKEQTKGYSGEMPTSFSEDDAANSSSSMD